MPVRAGCRRSGLPGHLQGSTFPAALPEGVPRSAREGSYGPVPSSSNGPQWSSLMALKVPPTRQMIRREKVFRSSALSAHGHRMMGSLRSLWYLVPEGQQMLTTRWTYPINNIRPMRISFLFLSFLRIFCFL